MRESSVFDTRIDAPPRTDAYALGALDRHLGATWPALLPHRAAVLALGYHETDRAGTFNLSVLGARRSVRLRGSRAGTTTAPVGSTR